MLNIVLRFLVVMALVFSLTYCDDTPKEGRAGNDRKALKEPLIKANEHLQDSEEELISDFVARYNWEMQTTGNGLRYMIYHHGQGPEVKKDSVVKLEYTLNLLNGRQIYSSDESGPMQFIVGHSEVERGLEEAVLLLREGDRAKIIIPSHLGYGLIGDGDQIPARATLIYDIEITEVSRD